MGKGLGPHVDGKRRGLLAHGVRGRHGLLDLIRGRHGGDADDSPIMGVGHGQLRVSRHGTAGEPEGAKIGITAHVHVLTVCQQVAIGSTPPSTITRQRRTDVDKFGTSQMQRNFGMFSVSERFESRAAWLSHHPGPTRGPDSRRARR
jgi:hypothetical protein